MELPLNYYLKLRCHFGQRIGESYPAKIATTNDVQCQWLAGGRLIGMQIHAYLQIHGLRTHHWEEEAFILDLSAKYA